MTDYTKGDFDYNSFFQNISGLVSRRTTTGSAALATVADTPLSQGEMVKVKVNRKIGPVANTLDAFKKIQKGPFDEDALNFAVGVQSAKAMQVEMLNTALRALRAPCAPCAQCAQCAPRTPRAPRAPCALHAGASANLSQGLCEGGWFCGEGLKYFVGVGPFCKRISSPTPLPPKTFSVV